MKYWKVSDEDKEWMVEYLTETIDYDQDNEHPDDNESSDSIRIRIESIFHPIQGMKDDLICYICKLTIHPKWDAWKGDDVKYAHNSCLKDIELTTIFKKEKKNEYNRI